jgi:hypothetical protein
MCLFKSWASWQHDSQVVKVSHGITFRPPGADCCGVFRVFCSRAVSRRRRVLPSLPDAGAVSVWRHHTRLEALSP